MPPKRKAPAAQPSEAQPEEPISPNQTIYIKNLDEKVKKLGAHGNSYEAVS
jgi:hypothetical protein